MFTFKRLRRRVLISHSHGRLRVKITADNESSMAVVFLVWMTGFAAVFFYTFTAPMFRLELSGGEWFLALIPVSVAVVYCAAFRVIFWQAFGVDDIVVERGRLHWSAKALWFKQEAEFPIGEISQVKAVTSWFGKRNHVEMTVGGRRYLVGNRLLMDETTELADALKRALGVR
jgi:hypothetical protein